MYVADANRSVRADISTGTEKRAGLFRMEYIVIYFLV